MKVLSLVLSFSSEELCALHYACDHLLEWSGLSPADISYYSSLRDLRDQLDCLLHFDIHAVLK